MWRSDPHCEISIGKRRTYLCHPPDQHPARTCNRVVHFPSLLNNMEYFLPNTIWVAFCFFLYLSK